MNTDKVLTIKLKKDEALVIFEYLSKFQKSSEFDKLDGSEKHSLLQILGQLEKNLVEPFNPNYKELLESSKQKLREKFGSL